MTLTGPFRLVAALGAGFILAGCAQPPGAPELDISQFVQTQPRNLRAVDVLPRGLGSDGSALLLVEIGDENPEIAASEGFELVLAEQSYDAERQRTTVTYVLEPTDYRRFTELQVRARAQLLAGYAQVRMLADSAVCDEAGVELAGNDSPLMVQNAATGRTILTVRPQESLARIKERVPYCT